MLDVSQLSILLMEEQYPLLTEEQLLALASMYSDINQACYVGCLMKAQANKITVGPITIENDSNFWLQLADSFKLEWLSGSGLGKGSRSITGKTVGRADEF